MSAWKKMITAAALMFAAMQAGATPVLTFSAPVANGSSVDVDVLVSNIADLYSYQFSVGFDASALQVASVATGAFLGTAGATFGDTGSIDNAAGSISFAFNTLLEAIAGASGSGTLLSIHFDALNGNPSTLNFSDVLFLDSKGNDIAVDTQTGNVNAVPEPASALLLGVGAIAFLGRRRRASTMVPGTM